MESPVIIENVANFAAPVEKTGFPFDDTDYDTDDRFRSRLSDIAERHPEFATHLNFDDFPSLRRKRNGSSSQSDREFPSSGSTDTFGFPRFDRFPFGEFQSTEEKPPEPPRHHHRGRKTANPNLPQHLSNTVDLGQKQAPVEETRSQRSMSAPPENRSQRSDDEHKKQPSSESDHQHMGGNSSTKAQEQSKEKIERIIPIYVEGRDEPLIPKADIQFRNPEAKFSGKKKEPETIFTGKKVHVPGEPSRFPQQNMGNSQPFGRWSPPTQSQPQQQHQQQPPTSHHHKPAQTSSAQNQQEQHPPPQQPPPPPVNLNDPLEKIKSVKNDVLELMKQVEVFDGTRKDKTYLYLDEMLTRNLLKLDDIETEGKENIRQARREAIKCIQECISRLEAIATSKETDSAPVSEEQPQEQPEGKMETTTGEMPVQAVEEAPEPEEPKVFKSEATLTISTPPISGDSQVDPMTNAAAPMEVEDTSNTEQNVAKC